MKRITLHTGDVLEFPDETQDAVIAQTVAQHLSGGSAQSPVPAGAPQQGGMLENLMSAMQNVGPMIENMQGQHEGISGAAGDLVNLMADMSRDISMMSQAVSALAQEASQISEVVNAVNNLSTTISDSMSALLKFLALRRNIIYQGETPTGIQVQNVQELM